MSSRASVLLMLLLAACTAGPIEPGEATLDVCVQERLFPRSSTGWRCRFVGGGACFFSFVDIREVTECRDVLKQRYVCLRRESEGVRQVPCPTPSARGLPTSRLRGLNDRRDR